MTGGLRSFAVLFLIAWGSASAAPTPVCAGNICVEQAWARAMPPTSQTAAVYFSVVNKGDRADTLKSASTAAAGLVMMHRTTTSPGNIVRMEMVGGVNLAPGARVTFAPIGYHLMLEGLKERLTQGKMISVTLQFEKAGTLAIPVQILGVTATGPS